MGGGRERKREETDRQTRRGGESEGFGCVYVFKNSHGNIGGTGKSWGACRLSEHNIIDFKDHSIKCQ